MLSTSRTLMKVGVRRNVFHSNNGFQFAALTTTRGIEPILKTPTRSTKASETPTRSTKPPTRSSKAPENPTTSAKALERSESYFVNLILRSHNVKTASSYIKVMEREHVDGITLNAYNAYISILLMNSGEQEKDNAWKILDRMTQQQIEPNLTTFENMVKGFKTHKMHSEVLKVMDLIQERSWTPSYRSFNTALIATAALEYPKQALKYLEDMKENNIPIKLYNYNSALRACASYPLESIRLIEEMHLAEHVQPNILSYLSVLITCGRNFDYLNALEYLEIMEVRGIEPDLACFNAVIHACARVLQTDLAFELLNTMKSRGIAPDITSYASCLAACDKEDEWQRSKDLFEEMQQNNIKPNNVACLSALSSWSKAGRTNEVFELIEYMETTDGLELSLKVFGTAMVVCDKNKDIKNALKVMDIMKKHNMIGDDGVYAHLLIILDHHKEYELLCEHYNELPFPPSPVILRMALRAFSHVGDWQTSISILSQMHSPNNSPNLPSINLVLGACSKAEQWTSVISLYKWIRKLRLRPDQECCNTVLSACSKVGDHEAAFNVLTDIKTKTDFDTTIHHYNLAIYSCATSGEATTAYELLKFLKTKESNVRPDSVTYSSVIIACCKTKEFSKAVEVLENMKDAQIQITKPLLNHVISSCRQAGDETLARDIQSRF